MVLYITIKSTETMRNLNVILSEFNSAEVFTKLVKIVHSDGFVHCNTILVLIRNILGSFAIN